MAKNSILDYVRYYAGNVKQAIAKGRRISTTSEFGKVGTAIAGGLISEEYNPNLLWPQAGEVYDEMRRGDATTIAILEAIKVPLVSANWFIIPGGDTPFDKQVTEYARRLYFALLDFNQHIKEALGFCDFGYYYFEKVIAQLADDDPTHPGFFYYKKFAPRYPKAHLKWSIDGKDWVDGHPAGVTQQTPTAIDENSQGESDTQPTIPWEKLILYSFRREGNNYEGVSLLRNAYKHWYYKDLMYKTASISAERFGVGLPWAKPKKGANEETKSKIVEFLKNIRSNEQNYALITDDIKEWDIMVPKGDPKANAINDFMKHQDRKIYDSILAGFLNLSSGDGGSNALSKDQSLFFLRGLQGIADFIISVNQPHLEHILDINFPNIENYPKIGVSDIGITDVKGAMEALGIAAEKGLVDITDKDKDKVRSILKLPELTDDDKKQINEEKEQKKIEEKEREKIEAEKREKMTPTEKESIEHQDKIEKEMAEVRSGIVNLTKKYDDKSFADKKKKSPKPTQREKEFVSNITAYESYLDSEYANYDKILAEFEEKYRKGLVAIYQSSETERVDGVVSLKYSNKMIKKAIKFVDDLTKKLEEKLVDSPAQRRLFRKTRIMAVSNLKNNEKLLKEIEISEGQFNSFLAGYISNVQGILYNEPRRIQENVTLNYGAQVSLDLAVEQASGVTFNRNVFKLSTVTHARATYKNIVFNESEKEGFTFYKVLVPSNRMKDVIPGGTTGLMLFMILTAAQINKRISERQEGRNTDSVKGLGLHHGSYEYYYPIQSDMLDEETEISKEQRSQLNN